MAQSLTSLLSRGHCRLALTSGEEGRANLLSHLCVSWGVVGDLSLTPCTPLSGPWLAKLFVSVAVSLLQSFRPC